MPIYAYKCAECGFAKDVLQKMSDPLLTVCPSCGKPEFKKQVTAAGFQLKGSGWYVTDFKGGSGGTSAPATDAKSSGSDNPPAASSAPEPAKSASTGSSSSSSSSSSPSTTPSSSSSSSTTTK